MEKKDQILKQSLAIRTFPIQKVKDICDSFSLEKHDEVKPFDTKIKKWLEPVIDLFDFQYVYSYYKYSR